MSVERWKKAQLAEKKYWGSPIQTWSAENPKQYWQEKLAYGFNLNYEFFTDKSVLEVGCGPHGIIFHLDNAKQRVGLEPLDLNDLIQEDWKKSLVRKGIGEKMPFDNDSFDVILSFNTLDHCVNPSKVIEEVHRILRQEGDFLLWVHILQDRYNLLKSFLNKFDVPHPHHLRLNEILILLKDNSLNVKHSKHDKGVGLHNNTLKNVISNYMMNTLWLWCRKIG